MSTRTLTFPTDRSVGMLGVFDPRTSNRERAEARGAVDIAEGCKVTLQLNDDGCARPNWAAELPADAIVAIRVPPGVTSFSDETAKACSRFTELKQLVVSDGHLGDEGIATVGSLHGLVSLTLPPTEATDLSPLGNLTELSLLVVGAQTIEADALRALAALKALRSLSLVGPVDDAGLAVIGTIRDLTSLTLAKSEITAEGWRGLEHLTSLESLSISESPVGDEALGHIVALPGLRSFATDAADVTDAGLEQLARAVGLTKLSLPNASITGVGLSFLAPLSDLTVLHVPEPALSGGGAEALAKLPTLQQVHAEGADVIAFLPILEARPEVTVNGLQCTAKGVARLVAKQQRA